MKWKIACTAKWGSSGANPQGANAAIAFICEFLPILNFVLTQVFDIRSGPVLFGFVYSVTYTPLQALYPAECLDYNTRFVPDSLP